MVKNLHFVLIGFFPSILNFILIFVITNDIVRNVRFICLFSLIFIYLSYTSKVTDRKLELGLVIATFCLSVTEFIIYLMLVASNELSFVYPAYPRYEIHLLSYFLSSAILILSIILVIINIFQKTKEINEEIPLKGLDELWANKSNLIQKF